MAEYIEREAAVAVIEAKQKDLCPVGRYGRGYVYGLDREKYDNLDEIIDALKNIPSADVAPVIRCGECIYYHPAHIKCPDGSEKGYNEMPAEAFDELGTGLVTLEYGINIGGQCEVEKYSGYSEDKSVFRRSDDFCSRGQGKERKNNG